MIFHRPDSNLLLMLVFLCTEAAFLAVFVTTILRTPRPSQVMLKRVVSVLILSALTYTMESTIVPLCMTLSRPHWAVTAASLLWIQLLSASEILLVSRVSPAQLSPPSRSLITNARSAIGLLWNMRRIGTQWQVKNVPSTKGLEKQSRAGFISRRLAATVLTYLFVDIIVSLPPPEPALIHPDKSALFPPHGLGIDDIIFRTIMTFSYFLTVCILNLFMTNVGAIVAVLSGLSKPTDCPPLYGSFSDAYTVRRFWGISWHQMCRIFITGHADLFIDTFLPFLRHTILARYTRQTIAFLISGLIHYRAEQLMGVPHSDNGAVQFFLLHSAVIMLEDAMQPLFSKVLPGRLRRVLGYVWVAFIFVWSAPPWAYPGVRLGIDAGALLPVRVLGPHVKKLLES